jgi:hypothetical protein
MKNTTLYSLLAICIVIGMAFTTASEPMRDSALPGQAAPGIELSDSVLKFVQKACMDCHSDDGSSTARSKLNFSKWSTYDAEKQVKKANAICREITKNAMPPKKWRANNPDKVPTQAEIDMVCNWVKTIQK